MPRPVPTPIFHFTRIEHLETIVDAGLHCDTRAQESGVLAIEVGDTAIKGRRSQRPVPVQPGGFVSHYVPFYFAPRSPMMYSIAHGNVSTYSEGTARIAYLVTSMERLTDLGLDIVVTDRNAVLGYAEFARLADGEPPDDFIDWPLMDEQFWNNTEQYPARKERRMAECLVHGTVPWLAFDEIAVRSEPIAEVARSIITARAHRPRVSVRPDWYF